MSMLRMSAKADCASILVAFLLGAVGMPAAAAFESPWSIAPIEPATLEDVSRVLWWRDSIGVVFGTNAAIADDGPSLDAVHAGGAWRLPLERGIDLTLRSELVGTRTSVEAWRSGATWSLDLAPNASINASAWWTAPQDESPGASALPDGEGAALVGFTLRF
jgi:hypothetical protein